jgi:ammonium transporter, Amt family
VQLGVGWLGFNGGSALAAGYSAGRAFTNTQLAGASGMVAWSLCEIVWADPDNTGKYFKGRPTAIGAATGAVVGLVGITPACGFISQMWALGVGLFCSIASYWAIRFIKTTGIDDRLECLGAHGVAGALGTLLTGLMASTAEGSPSDGAFYGNGMQFVKQLAGLGMTLIVCVIGTTGCYWLVWGIGWVFKTDVRIAEQDQANIDSAEHGEMAYARQQSSYSLLSDFAGGGGGGPQQGGFSAPNKPLFSVPEDHSRAHSTAAGDGSSGQQVLEVAASHLDLLATAINQSVNGGPPGIVHSGSAGSRSELQLRAVTTKP